MYYEKRLILYDENGRQRTVYTDFTIPLIMDYVMYWEHNGLLDDEVYLQRNIDKLRLYHLNGIYQPKNLIITADKPGGGIAFAVPVQSIAGIKVLQYLTTASAEEG